MVHPFFLIKKLKSSHGPPCYATDSPIAANEFLRFLHKKTLNFAHFLFEKGHAVSAVTINNAKIFLQLMSKSRSLAKISERKLQPLLV